MRQVGLVYGASADVLGLDTGGGSKLMLDAQAPFHEVGRVECAVGDGCHGDWRKTRAGVCQRRSARKLARGKSCSESLIRGDGSVDGAVGDTGRNGHATDCAEKTALESLDVGRIDADQVGDAAGQNVAEDAETGAQHGLRFELPCDGHTRLQNRERRGSENIVEAGLNRCIQRLIHVVRDGCEGSAQPGDLLMWVQRIGVEGIAHAEGPRQLARQLPSVLRVEVKVEEVERLVGGCRESFRRCRCDSVNILWQRCVSNSRDRALAEVVVIEAEDSRIGSEAKLVRAVAPSQVVIDEEARGAPSLNPGIVQSSDGA